MPKKQTIAVDIDDVLAFTAEGWVEFTNNNWGTNFTIDDYDEDWIKVWKVDLVEGLKRRDLLHRSGVLGGLCHNKESEQVLRHLAKKYRLIIVTSRVEIVRMETLEWLNKHFKGIFEAIKFSGFYDGINREAVKLTKANLLKELYADYLIDDQLKHCLGAAELGIKALIFGDYNWNRLDKLPAGVTRVKDWPEVARYFDAKS